MRRLRPVVDTNPDLKLPEPERRKMRLEALDQSFKGLWELAMKNRPFYAADVWELVGTLIQKVRQEALEFQWRTPNYDSPGYDEKYYGKVEENTEAIVKLVEDIATAIRRRVAPAVGVPGTGPA